MDIEFIVCLNDLLIPSKYLYKMSKINKFIKKKVYKMLLFYNFFYK